MKTLRDTATLVVLILPALTVRVETRDASPIDIGTPAHAAAEQEEVAEAKTVIDTFHETACPVALALPGVASNPRETVQHLVWELDGKRVVIVVGDDEPSDPPSPAQDSPRAAPSPCDAQRARISC